MKLENKIKRYLKLNKEATNTVDKAWYLHKLHELEKQVQSEFNNRIDLIYKVGGQYCPSYVYDNEINEIKKDIENTYNCKIDVFNNVKLILI